MVLPNSGSAARRRKANIQEVRVLVGKEELLYSGGQQSGEKTDWCPKINFEDSA